jgi:hypothetical protein
MAEDSTTVTLDGIDFDAEEAKEAIEDALDDAGNANETVGLTENLIAVGDSDNDSFLSLGHLDDVSRYDGWSLRDEDGSEDEFAYGSGHSILRDIESALEDDEPDTAIAFESAAGNELLIDADADFEVRGESRTFDHNVVGTDEDAVLEASDQELNTSVDDALGGGWDGDWYFVEMRMVDGEDI